MDLRNVAQHPQGICNCRIEQIGNRQSFVLDRQRLAVITLAMADFTCHVDVGEETHFDFAKAVSLTCLASAAFDIEAKTSRFVPPGSGFRQHGVELANWCEDASIRCGIGPRSASNWRLIDFD